MTDVTITPDALTIPDAPVDAAMLPELLSAKLRALSRLESGDPSGSKALAFLLNAHADEAEALEARVRNGRTRA